MLMGVPRQRHAEQVVERFLAALWIDLAPSQVTPKDLNDFQIEQLRSMQRISESQSLLH